MRLCRVLAPVSGFSAAVYLKGSRRQYNGLKFDKRLNDPFVDAMGHSISDPKQAHRDDQFPVSWPVASRYVAAHFPPPWSFVPIMPENY